MMVFEFLSWRDYLTSIGVLLLVYYGYVAIRYYRKEMTGVLQKKEKAPMESLATGGSDNAPMEEPHSMKSDILDVDLHTARELVDQIRDSIREGAEAGQQKFDVLSRIRGFIQQVSYRMEPAFQHAVSELILNECAVYQLMVSEQDVQDIWQQSPE